jgi:Flp pilus assembly protein TadD
LSMRTNKSSLRSTVRSVPFAVAAALVVTGCSNTPFARVGEYQRAQHDARLAAVAQRPSDEQAPPAQLTRPDERDYIASATYWGAQVQANPDDIEANLNFSRNLRMMGGAAQAATVMRPVVLKHPSNARALAEYGKALTAAERPQDAIGFLTQAIQLSPNDWTLLSARGVAYDQANNHTAARADYRQALSIDEENPTVLTNLALSHVLSGQPEQAEPILRRVVARPDATAAMRQNLAMVMALQGRHQEATEMGKVDLEPEDAMSNAALFSQFDAKPSAAPVMQHSSAPKRIEAEASALNSTKLEASIPPEAIPAGPSPTIAPISGDPMATPIASASVMPTIATQAPRNMAPVEDDNDTATSPAITAPKTKPVKRTVPKQPSLTAARKPALPVTGMRPTTSNGETLITTINGIPVIGDAKPKGKPSASADSVLRGGSL